MTAKEIYPIEGDRMKKMIYRILSEEKRNIKTRSTKPEMMINTIELIIKDETKRLSYR